MLSLGVTPLNIAINDISLKLDLTNAALGLKRDEIASLGL